MKTLTKRQSQILDYVKDFIKKNGYAPSIRDITAYFGFKSPRAAHKHLITLEEKGFIERKGVSRGIVLTEKTGEVFTNEKIVPIMGVIAAGAAIEAVENVTDSIPLPYNFFSKDGEYFALKVDGESMIESHIKSGDYVIIKKQSYAKNGEIIVALIDNNYATLKTYEFNGKEVHLIPQNKTMDVIKVFPDRLRIQGVLVGLIRVM
ncbi:MAG TPA: transcriptional repressor LexA [Tepiditoga sp.]|nr:transcriptional repressor LexA [Thermotogota bacterium]HOO74233.1 transcriptional repressor LexA [Tepiditoga sp.]